MNADQAVVADQIVSGKGKEAGDRNLLAVRTDKPMEIIGPKPKEPVSVEGGGSKPK